MYLIKTECFVGVGIFLLLLIFSVNITAQPVTEYTAKPEIILEKEFDVVKMFAVDDYLIISKQQRYLEVGEYLFRLLKLPNMELVCEFGTVGRGPNEFEKQTRYNNVKVFKDSIQFWMYELNRTNLNFTTLHLENKKNIFLKINNAIKVPYKLNLSNIFYLGDSIIAGKVISMDMNLSRLRFYNFYKREVFNCPLITKVKNKNSTDMRYVWHTYNSAFISFVDYSKENEVFVSAMKFIDRIDLYNKSGEHIRAIVSPKTVLKAKRPEDIILSRPGQGSRNHRYQGTLYYRNPIVYQDFFAVLYFGIDMNDALIEEHLPCELRFYDYNGNQKSVLHLNENINCYTIDEKRGVLYASNRFSGENYRYNIKQLLDEF